MNRGALGPSAPEPHRLSKSRTTGQTLLIWLGLVVLVALVYSPVRGFDFVPLDDPTYVSENPHVLGGLTWHGISWAFTSHWASYWIPLTWVSYMTEVQFFGPNPGVHHVTNVVLHAINALLLFVWLRRVTGATWRSATVAALFAAHPLHVESVAWITERKDVLSTCFLFLALICYGAYVRRRHRALHRGDSRQARRLPPACRAWPRLGAGTTHRGGADRI